MWSSGTAALSDGSLDPSTVVAFEHTEEHVPYEDLRTTLEWAIRRGDGLVVDVSRRRRIDLDLLSALDWAATRSRAAEMSMVIVSGRAPAMQRILAISGLSARVACTERLEDAQLDGSRTAASIRPPSESRPALGVARR